MRNISISGVQLRVYFLLLNLFLFPVSVVFLIWYYPILNIEFSQDTLYAFPKIFHNKCAELGKDSVKNWFNTCAVVMSSGYLINSSFGHQIDSHDCVIRFNDAPAGGQYSSDVGNRTTVRILGREGASRLLQSTTLV